MRRGIPRVVRVALPLAVLVCLTAGAAAASVPVRPGPELKEVRSDVLAQVAQATETVEATQDQAEAQAELALSEGERTAAEGSEVLAEAEATVQENVTLYFEPVRQMLPDIGGGPTGFVLRRADVPSTPSSAVVEQVPPEAAWVMVAAAGAMGGALLSTLVWSRTLRTVLLLPLLSRIGRSQIFDNEARRLVAQLVQATPGLCLNDLVARTGYSRNAISYHLFVLEKEEELVSLKDGKYRRYFPRGGPYVNGAKNVVSALRNEVTLRMAQHVVANPGAIQRELCRVLATTPSAACWHAKRLEALGVIRKERVANTVQYYPGPALAKYDLSEFELAAPLSVPTAPSVPAPA